jgi:5S rRNA maturation endonuclease (ribonuclease M5)
VNAAEIVIDKLGKVTKSNTGWTALCPAHADKSPSLSVSNGDGKVLINCHAGCPPDAVLRAIGLDWPDLFDDAETTPAQSNTETKYRYVDAGGELLFEVIRRPGKRFHQSPANGRTGPGAMQGVPLVLYRLPAVIEAATKREKVYICEGEKDADRLTREGVTASTNPMGAGKWSKVADHAAETLAGVDVIVVQDRDDPGRAHAADVAQRLEGVAASVRIVEPLEGKDVSDHLAAGRTLDELAPVDPTTETTDDAGKADPPLPLADRIRARLLSTEQLRELPPPEPLIDGWLNVNSLAMMFGPSGAGKSFVAIDMAMTVGSRRFWHSNDVTNGLVLYVVAEGTPGASLRSTAWETHHRTTSNVTWHPGAVNISDPAWATALAEVVAELKPVLVVIDTLARSIVGADENSSKDIGITVEHLEMIRNAAGCCVLIVHHAGKDVSKGGRGSTALKGAMDTEIEVNGTENRITVKNTKQKDAAEAPTLHFKLEPVPGTDSVVIVQTGRVDPDELPNAAFDTLAALRAIDVPEGVPSTAWRLAADASERSFFRHRSGLLKRGHVNNVGSDKQPRYRPADGEEE